MPFRLSCLALLFGALFVFPPQTLLAESTLTFAQAIAGLDSTSPALAESNAALETARAAYAASRGFPNPSLVGSQESLNDDDHSTERSIGVSQNIGFLWTQSHKQSAAKAALRSAEASHVEYRRQLVVNVLARALEYARLRSQSDIVDSVLARVVVLKNAATARRVGGDISAFDEQRLALEHIQLENQKQELQKDKFVTLGEIIHLTGLPAQQIANLEPVTPPAVPFKSVDEAVAYAQSHRPEIARTQQSLKAATKSHSQARWNQLPDLTLGVGNKTLDPGPNGFYLEGELEIPLWTQRRGERNAARAQLQRAQIESGASRNTVQHEVEAAFAHYTLVLEYQTLLETNLADSAVVNMNRGVQLYLADEISALELVDALRTGIEAHDAILKLKNSLAVAVADLRRATGLEPLEN